MSSSHHVILSTLSTLGYSRPVSFVCHHCRCCAVYRRGYGEWYGFKCSDGVTDIAALCDCRSSFGPSLARFCSYRIIVVRIRCYCSSLCSPQKILRVVECFKCPDGVTVTATSCDSRPSFGLSSARFFRNSVVRICCHCSSLCSPQKRM